MSFLKNISLLLLFSSIVTQPLKDKYIEYIISVLKSGQHTYETLDEISKLKNKVFIPHLHDSLKKTKSDALKLKIIETLFHLSDNSQINTIYTFAKLKIPNIRELEPRERIRAVMKENVKVQTINIIGNLKLKEAKDLLVEIIKTERTGRAVDEAKISLAKLGEKVKLEEFIWALKDKDYLVRVKACEILGEIGDASVVKHLVDALNDWSDEVKIQALKSLAKIKDTNSAPHIQKMLYAKNPLVRATACESLASLEDKKYIGDLKIILEKDENGYVRLCSAGALLKLHDKTGEKVIMKALESEDRDAKLKAIEIIYETKNKAFLEKLIELFEKEQNPFFKLKIAATILAIKK